MQFLSFSAAACNQQDSAQQQPYSFHLDPALFHKSRKGLQHIRRQHPVLPQLLFTQIPGSSMEPDAAGRRLQRLDSLPQEADDHSRQHISAAPHGHSRIACGIAIEGISVGNPGSVSFQNNHAAKIPGKHPGSSHPIRIKGASQADKLTVMGCQNGWGCPPTQ